MLGAVIDGPGAMVGLKDFVDRFTPKFTIGALMDPNTSSTFGQWGPRRLLVPQVYLVDKGGNIVGQFMGSDGIFEGDKIGQLRAAVNHMMGADGSSKPVAAAVVKKK